VALIETRDVVFREAAAGGVARAAAPAPTVASWREPHAAGPVLLFRYSALTFNSHRIHYDQRYATEVEGYPALVVQGPLLATLLAESLGRRAGDARVRAVDFRAVSAVFADEPFEVAGRIDDGGTATAWAAAAGNRLAMSAEARFA
jgi:3-methylfumaryl-CoA hydratase